MDALTDTTLYIDPLVRAMEELQTLRRLIADSERHMTPHERALWRARVTYYLRKSKERPIT